jgi:hypothetical protein
MSDEVPYTEKKLKDWAGWRAFRDGKALFERGVVEKVTYEHPFITGMLNLGPRGMRSKFEILKNGLVENHCPCRDNQERGLICSHLVAMGLEVLKRHSDPSRNQKAADERQRIDRIAKAAEGNRIKRVRKDAPGAVKANLLLELARDWEAQIRDGKVNLHVSVEYEHSKKPATDVPTDVPFSFSRRDENILYVLEDICGGALKSDIQISVYDLINILRLHHGKNLHLKGQKKGFHVNNGMLDTVLEMDMDRDDGELILHMDAELPDGKNDLFPTYIIGEKSGWIFSAGEFWPLSNILPKTLHEVYSGEMLILRESVPAFLMTELPQAEKVMKVDTDITPDLFHMKPAKPTFRLVVKGSPASLAATLYARYNDDVELVAGRADMRGNFAIPDPKDLLRYRIRNRSARSLEFPGKRCSADPAFWLAGRTGRPCEAVRGIGRLCGACCACG